jgi:hypothetical protein
MQTIEQNINLTPSTQSFTTPSEYLLTDAQNIYNHIDITEN